MIDVTGEISAVRREVGGRVLEAGQARVVTLSRSYPAELADVWDACTSPERIPRWFLPVSGELKEGGRYQLEGNAGGTITRCDPPRGFDATWEMGGDVSWIELRLAGEGNGRTLFRLVHIAHVDDQRWAQFGPGAVGVGWDSGLIGLYLHLTTRQAVDPRAYWINLASLDRTACGIFLLSSLNPTIGRPGDSCVNFVTHLRGRDRPLFQASDDELLARYREDFQVVFGFDLEPFWTHVARVPMYSPVFGRSFRNPPLRSASWRNLYFAGNYRTFPTIVSTGTALGSGVETGRAVLEDLGERTDLATRIGGFRLGSMPRA